MNVKKLYHKPLLLLKTRFIKFTTKKMAKRKGNKTKSNTVQRLRKKYPQRPGDRHDFFLVEKKERYHVVLSKSYTTGWEMNCENKSSIYHFMQEAELRLVLTHDLSQESFMSPLTKFWSDLFSKTILAVEWRWNDVLFIGMALYYALRRAPSCLDGQQLSPRIFYRGGVWWID